MDKKVIKISQRKRQLRERKQKVYADVWALGDEELESGRAFSVAEKLASSTFAQKGMVKEIKGSELNVAYFQQFGFNIPLLVKEKDGLGIQMPSAANFSINDVRMCVGSNRMLDVMDVNTQKNIEMTMKEWQRYYEDPSKKKLLNVISLEFSHTKLDNYVQCPSVVREVDWTDVVWPKSLKAAQREETNSLNAMMYPKVQKYCLMSVKNCYTDFHIDFGGTSVWYHILKGSKVFWLIPPTDKNLALYEKWVLSGKQSSIFFGDTVEKCARIYLTAGNTFFIPSGWIHAVYTPTDSLVFGGNFLHSYSITKQLKIAQVEDVTKVPVKFRYPFFTEMLWYVLAKYVAILLKRNHLDCDANRVKFEDGEQQPHVHLTNYELFGLKEIVLYLYDLPQQKKNVPELLKDPVGLIKDVRLLVEKHCKDDNQLAITGVPVLKMNVDFGSSAPQRTFYKPEDIMDEETAANVVLSMRNNIKAEQNKSESISPNPLQKQQGGKVKKSLGESNNKNNPRRRRTRCKTCDACMRSDCGECTFCLDMVKFGGPGKAKQTCQLRACLAPMLPVTCICTHCQLDGWNQLPKQHQQQIAAAAQAKSQCDGPSALMECSVCYDISHPECIQKIVSGSARGIINEDLPNSWQCPACCESGKNADFRPRHFRARPKTESGKNIENLEDHSNGTESNHQSKFIVRDEFEKFSESDEDTSQTPSTSTIIKSEEKLKGLDDIADDKQRKSGGGDGSNKESHFNLENSISRKRNALRAQLAQQIISSSSKLLKKPVFPVRPSALASCQSSSSNSSNLALDKQILLSVFQYLSHDTLVVCSTVCKVWADVAIAPELWKKMNCAEQKMTANLLIAIVRRQPENLILDWSQIAKQQLAWIISRITCLRSLSLEGVPIQSVFALHTCLCPQLTSLNLSFVRGLNDHAIREILSPPKDSTRPGTDSKSRLRNLKCLKLSGTDISDIALRYITHGLYKLSHLDISSSRITDVGICQIGTSPNSIETLQDLNLANCKLITEQSLEYLEKCEALTRLDLRHCPLVSTQEVIKFAAKSKNDLHVKDVKLVDKRMRIVK